MCARHSLSGCGSTVPLLSMQEQKSNEESSKALQDKEKELQKALKDAQVPLLLHTVNLWIQSRPRQYSCAAAACIARSTCLAGCWHAVMHIGDEVLACIAAPESTSIASYSTPLLPSCPTSKLTCKRHGTSFR